jgi:hypothetical protein
VTPKESRPAGNRAAQDEAGTSTNIEPTAHHRHSAPPLSEFGRAVLDAMAERDRRLVAELGVDQAEIREFAEALTPDAFDRLLVDALRWRRLHSDSSHAIAAAIDWRREANRPSHAELTRRRHAERRGEVAS